MSHCGKNSPLYPRAISHKHSTIPNGIAFANIKAETYYMIIIKNQPGYGRKPFFLRLLTLLAVSLMLFGCANKHAGDLSSPPEYDLTSPAIIKLPSYLDEISGIAYYPKDKGIFAINDEKGWLYKVLTTKNMAIQRWKYTKGDDFEDLVLVDSIFYVLQSSGNIVAFKVVSPDSVATVTYELNLPGENEFEILYHDKQRNQLVMVCKDCEVDNKSTLSSWAFDLSTKQFIRQRAYVMNVQKIAEMMNETKVKFKPSAAAIHPLSGKLYIVSSINKVLVVADNNGNPEKVYHISPKLYKQPEGMTFTPEGHLLISNESADIGAANILIFKYKKG